MEPLPDISTFRKKLADLETRMAEPSFFANPRKAAEATRERSQLRAVVDGHDEAGRLMRQAAETAALARDPATDAEIRELAAAELGELEARAGRAREAAMLAMVPSDPTDSRNTVLELRAGTGGEEAALFAAELARMYQKYADAQGWKVQPMSSSVSERGGFREAIFLVSGTDVYRRLKFESGVHRVQRVPVTEASGRIHTSTVTVAVLPEAEEVDVKIDPSELEVTVCRASGPGGQGVNTTDSAVQIQHKPTGLIVECADERSQIKNKARAMTVLRARLLGLREEQERAKMAAERRSQIGSGDRSERIRTYNFPQNRVTDHRIGLTMHNLPQALEGQIDALIAALSREDARRRLSAILGVELAPESGNTGDEDEPS